MDRKIAWIGFLFPEFLTHLFVRTACMDRKASVKWDRHVPLCAASSRQCGGGEIRESSNLFCPPRRLVNQSERNFNRGKRGNAA
eukprot:s2235_g16.t1